MRIPLEHAWLLLGQPVPCDQVVIQPNKKSDRAWNVNEGVQPIYPRHHHVMFQEKLLYRYLPKYVPPPFDFD